MANILRRMRDRMTQNPADTMQTPQQPVQQPAQQPTQPASNRFNMIRERTGPQKSAYQQNLAQPVQNDKWFSGPIPTSREIYGRIYQIGKTDFEKAKIIADGFSQAQADPTSPWYAPYKRPTNDAVATMASYGVDVSHIDDQWFADNSWLMQYQPSNAKKASKEQKMAYAFNQIAGAYDNDKTVQKEFAALQDEINYLANWKGRNYSDQQIKDMIYGSDGSAFAKKYPTLAKMDASMGIGGSLVKLNSGSDYSKENVDTLIWRARNGGGTGNMDIDTVYSVSGEGNKYIEDPVATAKANWNDPDHYSPFSTGMTLTEEGMYFDVYEFTPEKIEELRSTLDPNDATAMQMFDNVVAAEDTTVKAETERTNLMAKVDDWISKGYSYDKIMEKVDGYLDKNCPTLRAMDKSMKSSDQKLLSTTRAIDYKYEDLSRYVDSKTNAPKASGAEETVEVLSRAGEMLKMAFSPQQIETDKTETAILKDTVASVEDQMTPAELAYMNNAGSSLWDKAKAIWGLWNQSIASGKGISKEFALAQMEKADTAYNAAAFKPAQTISAYDNVQKRYDMAAAQYEQLSAQFSDQQYIGVQLNPRNRMTVEIDGKPVNMWINLDEQTGEYVFAGADFMDNAGQLVQSGTQKFRDYVGNEEEWNTLVEQETAKFNEYAQNVERVRAEGHRATKEGKEGLQEMYAAKAIMDDAREYLDKNQAAYDEAVKEEQKARDDYARTYRLLDSLGVNVGGGETHLAMFDYALQYGQMAPREKSSLSYINSLDDAILKNTEGYTAKDCVDFIHDSMTETDEQIADIRFLMQYFGNDIPEDYKKSMENQIKELEWDKKDYEYFLLSANDDFDDMVAKGKAENPYNSGVYAYFNKMIPEYWDTLTDAEQDRFYYLVGRDGIESAKEYFNHLNEGGMLDKRRMEGIREWSTEFAKDHVVLANLAAIASAPLSGALSPFALAYTALTGESASDTLLMLYNNVANEVNRSTVEQINTAFKDNPTLRTLVSGAYEIAYNRGRSVMNSVAFPGLAKFGELVGAVPMATTAMADKVMELKEAGATDAQAWLLGFVTLACEAGTEAIELKDIKAAKALGLDTLSGIKEFFKQYPIAGLNEALGESLNDIIENAADKIIMGDKSEFNDRVWHYRTTMGMSKEDAEAMAYKDELYNVMHTAIISFLSPGTDILSFAGGKVALYDHYRRQGKEYNMSIRDIRNAEQAKARYAEQESEIGERIENAPAMEYESQTREAVIDRYEQNEEAIDERVNSVPTLELDRAEREVNEADEVNKSYQTDMEVLETAGQTSDNNARSSSIAAVLRTGETDADNDIADAAAVNIGNAFEDGVSEVLDLMEGGAVEGVDPVTLKKGIQYAALGGEESRSSQVVHSEEYQAATPDQKALMLADAVNADDHNQGVQESVASYIRENQVAAQEAAMIRSGALNKITEAATQALKQAEEDVRTARNDLDAIQGEVVAATKAVDAAVQQQNENPTDDNYKAVVDAITNLGKRNESKKQYQQHLERMQQKAEQARANLERTKREGMADIRRQAEATVGQMYQDRAVVAQQQAEAMQKAAEVAEQARKDAQEFSNFSRLDAEEQIDRLYPNISGLDRARAIMTYMAIQKEASSTVQGVNARKNFTDKLAKKFNLNVKEAPANSLFNARIDPKTRTLYVNEKTNQSDIMYAILLHEITHPAEGAKEIYNEMADTVLGIRYGEGTTFNDVLDKMKRGDHSSKIAQDILAKKRTYDTVLAKVRGEHSYEEILQEIVADGVGYVISADEKALNRIAAEKPNLIRRIISSIRNFVRKMSGLDNEVLTQAEQVADKLEAALNQVWGGEQKNSITAQPLVKDENGNALATELPGGTIAIDTERFSLSSFNGHERDMVRQALYNAKDENGNKRFTKEEVDKYIYDAMGIAAKIAQDRHRLDFDVTDENKSMMKPNADYGGSIDSSTLCAKRLVYQGTFDAIQHRLKNTPLMPEDLIHIADVMREMGYETPCGICYVESRRRNLDSYIAEWLQTFEGTEHDPYIPQIQDVSTTDGLELVRKNHPETYDAFMKAMNSHGQQNNPKVVQLRTEYKGEIRDLTDDKVQKSINHGGIRLQSFSDFETPHLLDMVQVVMDMASRNLTSQAYTKVPNFAWVFGDTGIKINLSLIGKGEGVDANGNLLFDDVEGMPFEEAMKLRNRYSKNVGTILVGINDKHILAAMADPRIDYIIPFHSSGWTKEDMRLMPVINGYTDYQNDQNEKKIVERRYVTAKKNVGQKAVDNWIAKEGDNHPGYTVTEDNGKFTITYPEGYKTMSAQDSGLKNLEPVGEKNQNGSVNNGYWDFSKTGKENAEEYLRLCAKDGRVPKFSQFLVDNGDGSFSLQPDGSTDGYWKLLIDFKMYDNDGVGSPQTAVTPNMNMPEAYRVLKQYDLSRVQPGSKDPTKNTPPAVMKDNNSLPVAQPVVDVITEELKERKERDDAEYAARMARLGRGTAASAISNDMLLGNTESTENIDEDYSMQQNVMAVDPDTGESVRWRNSIPVTDPEVLRSLEEQEKNGDVTVTYRTMKLLDGKLVSPKATLINGKVEGDTQLGQWEEAAEHPELVKFDENGKAYFELKENGRTTKARYNPYMHSSNLMLNDQFAGAYQYSGDNKKLGKFVTVECIVPNSESTSGYHAKYAKDPVGWTGWKAGGVAQDVEKAGKGKRDVFLSRWIKPVRIVPDSEVAQHYKNLLDGTDIKVPANVVTPGLLAELEKAGVQIGPPDKQQANKYRQMMGNRYSLPSDAEYLSAVNHGDMEEAQRMVDEKAKEAGYDTGYLFWRGDSEPYTVLEPGEGGNLGRGLYFTEQRSYAEKFARGGVLRKFYLKRTNGSDITGDGGFEDFREFQDQWLEDNGYDPEDAYLEPETMSEIIDDYIAAHDFDYIEGTNVGGLAYGASETAVQNSWQAKLADPVTYDDDGNVIPLSERFNSGNDDIRYSLPSDDILEQDLRYAIENGSTPSDGTKDRQWGVNGLQESDEIDKRAKEYVAAHGKYYPDTNAEQINRAFDWIRSQKTPRDPDGYNAAYQKVTSPSFNYRTADGQARIIAMMGMAVARNDVPGQVQLADTYNKQGTVLGQALQARKLWKLMTPEGRIHSLENMLESAKAELTKRGIVLDKPLTFSNWVYLAATAEQEDGDMQRLYRMAGQELANQMPSNWRDKIRSIRMLAMLGNPRTHIRNIIGNALFVPAVGLKNKLGALMELGKKPGERTKTTALFLNSDARAFAREDALRMKDELRGESKYNELNAYQKEQKAFKGLLQAIIDFNSDKLEAEDWHFLRGHYVRALGGWMMANNYTAEQLRSDPVLLEKGRSYAILEAQKATYRDFSKMASTLNKVSREGGVAGFVVDAVLPFKKTPANILKRGVEYSPVGIMRSLTTDLYHLKQWNDAQSGKLAGIPEKAISPTQFIDRLCSGLSGTAIMGIGALLGAMGFVTCGLNDDDDKLEKEQGAQQYSIKILGTDVTYTMDWAAPVSMPFFVGAAVAEQFSEQDGFNIDDIVDALGNISEPVFNLSMLDGVNTLFKTSQYDDTNTITQIAAKIGSNYVTSYVPSLLGAIARTIDGDRRKAYVKSGEGTGVLGTLRYAWEQTENKIPGVSTSNIPYRDVWGNEETSGLAERVFENFISPGYINNYKNDPILKEMDRLYDVTHDKAMVPSDPAKSFKFNGENHVLTAEEWDRYKVARGQAAFNGLTELIGTQEYKAAEDDVKAEMIKEVWSYADKIGKNAAVPSYMVENKGENPIAEITRSSTVKGYESRMLQALELGDFDTYETMVEALHQEEVEDSAIKTKIGTAYRDKYKTAYINDDFATMAEIEEILDNTDFDFDLDAWEEQADEKYGRDSGYVNPGKIVASGAMSDVRPARAMPSRPSSENGWNQYMNDLDEYWANYDFGKHDPVGQYGKGTIDMNNRTVVHNADGSISTDLSFSFLDENPNSPNYGKEVLIPQVVNGRVVKEKEAKQHYYDTNEYFGVFDNWQDADEYSVMLHNRGDWYYNR